MAELGLAIFGVSLQVVDVIFRVHQQLEQIRDAPLDIQLFTTETFSVGNLVEYFGIHFLTTIEKLSACERTQAQRQAEDLEIYFSLVEQTINLAAGNILKTFADTNATAWKQFWNKWRWTSKQAVISRARISMNLFTSSVQMFMNTVKLQLLCNEADRFSPEARKEL